MLYCWFSIGGCVFSISNFLTIVLGSLGIGFGWHISRKIDKASNQKFDEITNLTSEIKNETKRLSEAASIRIVETFPDIFEKLEAMLKYASENRVSKCYIQNGPSSFGKIHSYNKRFLKDFHEKGFSDHNINKFDKKVKKLESLISDCARDAVDFKMLVSNTQRLNDFISAYFTSENSETDILAGEGLCFYSVEGNAVVRLEHILDTSSTANQELTADEKSKKDDIENKIKTEFVSFNETVISICEMQKTQSVVRNAEETELQIYLVDGGNFKMSLTIFYFDDNTDVTKKRRLVGTYTENSHIYKALENTFLKDYDRARQVASATP